MNKLLPFLVVLLFFLSLIPIGMSDVVVTPDIEFEVGNETYSFTQNMTFDQIVIGGSSWIKFNDTDFNVTSANSIDINLSFLHEDISTATNGTKVLDFVVNVTIGSVTFSIGGFNPSIRYSVKRNSTEIATPTADANGYISFTNSIWPFQHFEINVSNALYDVVEIVIGDDADFNAAHYVFSGSGTAGDPYIIENLKIQYLNISGWYNGTSVITKHFKIYNCNVTNAYIWRTPTYMDAGIVHIDHCFGNFNTYLNSGQGTWRLYYMEDALITNCTFEGNHSALGVFEVTGGHNNTFRNNTFLGHDDMGNNTRILKTKAIKISSSNDNLVENCNFFKGYVDIFTFNDYRTIIKNCTFNTTADEFIAVMKTWNLTIDNCSFYDRANIGHVVEYQYGANLTFTNNVVDTSNRGIEWAPTPLYSPSKITGDIIANNEFKNGIDEHTGILQGRAFQNCTFRNNTFTDCVCAIRFTDIATSYPVAYNLFYNNTFLRCKHAVRIWTTSASGWVFDNYFYNNSFTNYNVTDSGSYDKLENNTWYTAKTLGTNIIGGPYIGGNYWDNYTGSDTDSDGLGDTLIPFFRTGMDIYPLTTVFPKEDVMSPPINGTTGDDYVELYGYCSLGLDTTNFSADVNVDIFAPILWTVEYVNVSFITNNSVIDQTISATDYIQYNDTYRRYSCEYNPSNTLSVLDMGWFDVNVSATSYNATHESVNYTVFDDVFQVYKLSPPTNISSDYSSTTNTINLSWIASSENYSIFRPDSAGGSTQYPMLTHVGAANNWQCVDEAVHDSSTTMICRNSSGYGSDAFNIVDHTTEDTTITGVTVVGVFGSPDNSPNSEGHLGMRISSSEVSTGGGMSFSNEWRNYSTAFGSTNPATSTNWTWGDIDDFQIYVDISSVPGFTTACTQLYVIVDYEQWSPIEDSSTDAIVIVRNNDSYPVCPTDGYEVQNGTLNYYNTSVVFGEAYFSLFSYNDTTISYSEHIKMEWGVLGLSCYNESNPSQSIGFDIEITDTEGSTTYTASDLTNTHYIDINDIPYGDDTIFVISNSSYRQRIYYYDLDINNFYNYTFYLPPITTPVDPGSGDDGGNTTATQLYFVQLIDEANNAIPDVDVTVKRYINTTDSYEIVGSMVTGGYGYTSIYLIPNTLYKVVANKSGYVERIEDWLTDPIYYGLSYPNVIQLELEEEEYVNETTFNEVITFEAYMNSIGTIFVNYSDSLEGTTTTSICIYEDIILDVFHWDNRTGDDVFQFSVSGANTTKAYQVVLSVNHTTFGEQVVILFIIGEDIPDRAITSPTRFNALFNANYGTSPGGFGWSNFFGFFIMLAGVFSLGQRDAGISMLITGGLLLFVNSIIGLSVIGTVIPILFIVLGILVQWRNHRKEAVG